MTNKARYVLFPGILMFMVFLTTAMPSFGGNYTIYYESEVDGELAIFMYNTSGPVQVTPTGCQHPSITADGSMLYYTRITETAWGDFWNVFYVQNDEEYKLTRNEIYDEMEPTISRDGTFAAFTSLRGGNLEIITYPLDQDDLAYRITESPKPDQSPTLAMGEDYVYWTGRTGNQSYIFKAPGRGGAVERISAEGITWDEHPSVSADGRFMVYVSINRDEAMYAGEDKSTGKYPGYGGDDGGYTPTEVEEDDDDTEEGESATSSETYEAEGNSDIWVLDQVTGERTQLTLDAATDSNPYISSDGEVIVFTSDRDGNLEIYMVNRDGSGLQRLTDNDFPDDNATIN